MMLEGMPEPVAGFKMQCKFILKKPDGTCVRLVTLRNARGEKVEMLELPPEWFAQPGKFRWPP